MQDQKVFTILQECTVSLASPTGNGTGFFVAPGGWILTCDHVVVDHNSVHLECLSDGIKKSFTATVKLRLSDPVDVALLKIDGKAPTHKCVLLDQSLPLPGDKLSIFGYPYSYGSQTYTEGDTVRTEYEGESFRNEIRILKLKAGQIQDGLSGSPLFNERTKKVCGILSTSRNTESDLGGRATPVNLLFQSRYFRKSINDWNLITCILRENVNYHEKIDKAWSQSISKFYLDRKTALVVAAFSMLALIIVLAISPSNQVVMGIFRLIIACGFGYSIYLFIQSLNLNLVRSRRLPVSSLAGFIVTSTFLSLSLIAIPDRLIVLRNITGINEYPVFGLIEKNMPSTLKDTLGIRQEPIIDTHSPVYEAILAFRDESGNTSLMSKYEGKGQEITDSPIVSSEFNDNNSTVRSRIVKPLRGQATYKREHISQTSNDFETALTTFKGEGQEFYYTAGLMPIQTTLEDAKYTAFLPVHPNERPLEMLQPGSLLQYPKLSDVRNTLRFQFGRSWLNNEWFKNILEQNPNIRGFLAFEYKYLVDPSSDPTRNVLQYLFGCGFTGINRIAPSPYVRFIDIANKSLSSVKINTVSFQTISKQRYALTPISERGRLFQEIPAEEESFNISIPPGAHLILPIELGFDTRLSKNVRRGVLDTNGREIGTQSHQESDSGKLVGKTLFISQVPPTDAQGIILSRLPDESPKNIIEKYLQPTRLSASFINGTSSLQELSRIVPNRFAVGSLRNVVRIRVDDKDIQADTPLNDPRFSMTAYFAYGSCPYLMVYNSDKGYWEELGTVITGRQSKAEESYGIYKLGDHPQKFRIEERDMEVSYLNSISILYDDLKSGEEYELKTKIPELAANDERYHVLHQNEVLEINLKSLLPKDSANVRVKIQGFYEILSGVGPQNSHLPYRPPIEGGIGH